jgi:hypothetical protein
VEYLTASGLLDLVLIKSSDSIDPRVKQSSQPVPGAGAGGIGGGTDSPQARRLSGVVPSSTPTSGPVRIPEPYAPSALTPEARGRSRTNSLDHRVSDAQSLPQQHSFNTAQPVPTAFRNEIPTPSTGSGTPPLYNYTASAGNDVYTGSLPQDRDRAGDRDRGRGGPAGTLQPKGGYGGVDAAAPPSGGGAGAGAAMMSRSLDSKPSLLASAVAAAHYGLAHPSQQQQAGGANKDISQVCLLI